MLWSWGEGSSVWQRPTSFCKGSRQHRSSYSRKKIHSPLIKRGHNSGVIHSGIYYKPGSLKARICRAGIRKLTEFCAVNNVSYDLCGKVIVATNEDERARLHALYERGRANRVSGLELLSRDALKNIEPHAEGVAALLSPETGIVDYRDVAEKLGERIEHAGGTIRRSALVTGLERRSGSTIVVSSAGDVEARRVVCCAGLQADRVAKFSDGAKKLLIVPFRGEYYRLKPHRRCLVQNLIYPVPDPRFPFLGVHFTRRVDGEIEAGPERGAGVRAGRLSQNGRRLERCR